MYIVIYKDHLEELRPFTAKAVNTPPDVLSDLYTKVGGKISTETFKQAVTVLDICTAIKLFNETAPAEIVEFFVDCHLTWGAPKTDLAE